MKKITRKKQDKDGLEREQSRQKSLPVPAETNGKWAWTLNLIFACIIKLSNQ